MQHLHLLLILDTSGKGNCSGMMCCTVYNAANEKAVGLFLDRKIAYLQIPELIQEAMEQHKVIENPNVEEILETEASVYSYIDGKGF